MIRFYHRTRDGGYSNGMIFEAVRTAFPILVVLAVLGAAIGAAHGSVSSLVILLSLGLGIAWGVRRQRVASAPPPSSASCSSDSADHGNPQARGD